jgi:DNA polymerase-1
MVYFITNQRFIETEDIKQGSFQQCIEYISNIYEIGVDTETEGFDPYTKKILSIQVGDYTDQFFIEWMSLTKKQTLQLKEILESKDKLILLQNAKFDLKFLYLQFIYPQNIYDTFLAECILTTGYKDIDRDLSLKGLTNKYCKIDLDKSVRSKISSEGLSNRVIIYGANDIKYLSKIKKRQVHLIYKYSLEKVLELENEVVKVFAKLENNGICLNTKEWLDISDLVEKERTRIELEMDNLIYKLGRSTNNITNKLTKYCRIYKQQSLFFEPTKRNTYINWSSNNQKLKLLKDLGLKVTSVGDKVLQSNKYKHELIPLLLEYTKHNKLANTFGRKFLNFINPVTNRIHYNVWQILSTGRISVSNPNLNQIPSHGKIGKRIRSSFIPQEGYKIVGGDYSGMELRIIAEYSKDPTWVNAFNNGEDLHSKLCAMTFNMPIENVRKPFPPKPTFTYRDVQKTINFG